MGNAEGVSMVLMGGIGVKRTPINNITNPQKTWLGSEKSSETRRKTE